MPKKKSAANTPRSRQAVTLNLSPRAVTTVSSIRVSTGITQVAFLERLLEWYAAQDARIKTMILSPYPQVRAGLAKLIAKEMATNPEKDFDSDRSRRPHRPRHRFPSRIREIIETLSANPDATVCTQTVLFSSLTPPTSETPPAPSLAALPPQSPPPKHPSSATPPSPPKSKSPLRNNKSAPQTASLRASAAPLLL